ncbi:MAG TPA: tannase/feruloyl esterase family alpha/beta hydrolase [Bryobacteraceae bacterium]
MRTLAFLISGSLFATFAQTPCDRLKSLSLNEATITALEAMNAGPYTPPAPARGGGAPPAAVAGAPAAGRGAGRGAAGGPGAPAAAGRGAAAPVMLPAYCRVTLTLKPSTDSDIKMEIWMPTAETWNGKFQMMGNGGWAGSIQGLNNFPAALREGYAVSGTDTGHEGGNAVFGLGHPEKFVDFAYRAVHETVLKSKALMMAYYGKGPKLSYWNGCSTGGRQGLMEAQKFPEDFDAIIAGAPANYQTHLHAWDMNVAVPTLKDEQRLLTPAKEAALTKAVLAACDAMDGVKDGLLNDPRKCKFDPATMLCKNGDKDDCLTQPQVESAKLMYSPAKNKKGELIFPGKEPGSESQWTVVNKAAAPPGLSSGTFQYATYQDANYDWKNFDLDRDTAAADEKFGYVNATADLTAFKNRGGKLLMYHGWNDVAISPENSINQYESIVKKTGGKSSDWIKLYMIPGMQHCQGGPGTDQFNKMAIMERWRESNSAPEAILATHVTGANVEMTRPLCPYPQVATYKGLGSSNDAGNFSCK